MLDEDGTNFFLEEFNPFICEQIQGKKDESCVQDGLHFFISF